MENVGIDPTTSHMLSERSTTWANSPAAIVHVVFFFLALPIRGVMPDSLTLALVMWLALDNEMGLKLPVSQFKAQSCHTWLSDTWPSLVFPGSCSPMAGAPAWAHESRSEAELQLKATEPSWFIQVGDLYSCSGVSLARGGSWLLCIYCENECLKGEPDSPLLMFEAPGSAALATFLGNLVDEIRW